ncbi:hypothetical protein F8237_22055 [Bradyrhizobium betae]|uniref:Uncharacterized protein n=1 Tax=Bradyrhizobium betae TaxID=244734 RepID=A0A5P6P983_9BRAD|nr:hypothetical protein F8237_22055 [Bradyrhizobium betae]
MCNRKLPQLSLLAIGLLLQLTCFHGTAVALGSASSHDGPWNPHHIDQLPPDVRNAVLRRCGGRAQALHYFVTYLNRSTTVRLHFENLRCDGDKTFRRGESCLHQEFVAYGKHYRLAKHYYAPCND